MTMHRRAFLAATLAAATIAPLAGTAMAQEAAAPAAVAELSMGKADAPVTLIEYASYTCPHCQRFHEEVFGKIKANYIDTGKVRFIYREVYFDKYGLWAAMIARCGGEMKYFGISDMLYDTQKDWLAPGDDAGIAENLRKVGLKAGLSADEIDQCMNDEGKARAMVETYQKNATADKIEGTPSFIIDGQLYKNMGYDEFAATLDAKLAD